MTIFVASTSKNNIKLGNTYLGLNTTKRKRSRKADLDIPVISNYLFGKTAHEICEIFNIHTSRLYRILSYNNIPLTNNFSKWTGKTHTKETKEKETEERKT